MRSSADIGELAGALAKAQGEMVNPPKDISVRVTMKSGAAYNFKYADWASCLSAMRGPLSKNGLALIQLVRAEGNKVAVESILAHVSGQYLSEILTLQAEDGTPQKVGSAAMYAKRYGGCSLVGLVAEDDDDGNAASGHHVEHRNGPANPVPAKAAEQPAPAKQAQGQAGTPGQDPAAATEAQKKAVIMSWKDSLGYSYKELLDYLTDNEHVTKSVASELIKMSGAKNFDHAKWLTLTGIQPNAPQGDQIPFDPASGGSGDDITF